jgi:hypothetical protein
VKANLHFLKRIPKNGRTPLFDGFCFQDFYKVNLQMLTEDEKQFLEYWEQNGNKEKKPLRQIMLSAPLGLVFALPILVLVIFHGWYKNMVYISDAQLIVIIIAVLGIAVFFAMIRGKFKWENNEQLYKELKSKQKKENLPS